MTTKPMCEINKFLAYPWTLRLALFLPIWLTACASPAPIPVTETAIESPAQTIVIAPTDTPITSTRSGRGLSETEEPAPTSTPPPPATQPATATPTPPPSSTPTATATPDLSCLPWTWTASNPIHPDWPPFTFKVVGIDCDDFVGVQRIEIYRGDAAQPGQVIEEHVVAQELKDSGQGFEIADMNFDGYQDIRLLDEMTGGSSGVLYRHWLFDPQTETFVANEALNQRIGWAGFDAEQEQIRAFGRAGAGGQTTDYYHWVEGELTFIKQFETGIQAFENGTIFTTDEGVTYILNWSDWERLE